MKAHIIFNQYFQIPKKPFGNITYFLYIVGKEFAILYPFEDFWILVPGPVP